MSSFLTEKPKIIMDASIDDVMDIGANVLMQEMVRIQAQTVRGVPLDAAEITRIKVILELAAKMKTASRDAPTTTNNTVVVNKELKSLPTSELIKKLKKSEDE